jgi:SnoaL-like domain
MDSQAAVERFLTAFYTGDVPRIRESVITEFSMQGPFAAAHDVDELIELSKPLFAVVRGVRFRQWVIDGDKVSSLYDIDLRGPAGSGWMTMGGWFTVAGDRVTEGYVVYDSATQHAILSGR